MKYQQPPRELLLRYILAQASIEEIHQVEASSIFNPILMEDLLATLDEMIDDYLIGDLDQELRCWFERRAGASPMICEKLQFARALQIAISRDARGATAAFSG
jgi:hypothetical protein